MTPRVKSPTRRSPTAPTVNAPTRQPEPRYTHKNGPPHHHENQPQTPTHPEQPPTPDTPPSSRVSKTTHHPPSRNTQTAGRPKTPDGVRTDAPGPPTRPDRHSKAPGRSQTGVPSPQHSQTAHQNSQQDQTERPRLPTKPDGTLKTTGQPGRCAKNPRTARHVLRDPQHSQTESLRPPAQPDRTSKTPSTAGRNLQGSPAQPDGSSKAPSHSQTEPPRLPSTARQVLQDPQHSQTERPRLLGPPDSAPTRPNQPRQQGQGAAAPGGSRGRSPLAGVWGSDPQRQWTKPKRRPKLRRSEGLLEGGGAGN